MKLTTNVKIISLFFQFSKPLRDMSHGVMFQKSPVRLTTQVPPRLQLSNGKHARKDLTTKAMSANGSVHVTLVMPLLPGLSSLQQGRPVTCSRGHHEHQRAVTERSAGAVR